MRNPLPGSQRAPAADKEGFLAFQASFSFPRELWDPRMLVKNKNKRGRISIVR